MTIEELYGKLIADDEMKESFAEAIKAGTPMEWVKAQGVDAAEEELLAYVKAAAFQSASSQTKPWTKRRWRLPYGLQLSVYYGHIHRDDGRRLLRVSKNQTASSSTQAQYLRSLNEPLDGWPVATTQVVVTGQPFVQHFALFDTSCPSPPARHPPVPVAARLLGR